MAFFSSCGCEPNGNFGFKLIFCSFVYVFQRVKSKPNWLYDDISMHTIAKLPNRRKYS